MVFDHIHQLALHFVAVAALFPVQCESLIEPRAHLSKNEFPSSMPDGHSYRE
jgi:hypothetical protein